MRSTHGRELPALLACLVWILGFEVGPLLHGVEHFRFGSQQVHGHRHEGDSIPGTPHGEHSLLHRGVAARTPPPTLPPAPPPAHERLGIPEHALERSASAPVRPPRARGPPC